MSLHEFIVNVALVATLAFLLTLLSFTSWLFYLSCVLWSRV